MSEDSEKSRKKHEKEKRATAFAVRLAATGLSLSEFAKEAGFTRNVIYNLSIGQKPSSDSHAQKLDAAFERLRGSSARIPKSR
ncbi:MAG: hypothetical protein HKL92_08470 [Candidatus Eremiobacteraeota bacterium]|uniref:HTH cro/C1-type domain-containing protein n=1 Tax=mine drainage metagenome TaxID=410659 RepID=E6Q236_9ZZZZ|nr:hypothetical protein [Candidatus Eremiobacteraeota bacterium]NNM93362.1 hypothetical protein [Candidatus Eremiobacteraeota bacterium]